MPGAAAASGSLEDTEGLGGQFWNPRPDISKVRLGDGVTTERVLIVRKQIREIKPAHGFLGPAQGSGEASKAIGGAATRRTWYLKPPQQRREHFIGLLGLAESM